MRGRIKARAWSGWLVGLAALAGGLAAPSASPVAGPLAPPLVQAATTAGPVGLALHDALLARPADPQLAAFYAARGYQPLWIDGDRVRPEAASLQAMLNDAPSDNLSPDAYRPDAVAAAVRLARSGRPRDLARAEVALSAALGAFGADLHRPRPDAAMLYTDAAVRPGLTTRAAVLAAAAAAPSLGEGLATVRQMNPIYEGLRDALKRQRAWAVAGWGDRSEPLLRVNLERARALPANPGRRFVLVDVAAATLWIYEDGRPTDSMRVVVGKLSDPTPSMAGLIRYTVFRPYWNVPPDLVRNIYAPRVLKHGLGSFTGMGLEALSDWTDRAHLIDPATVDWAAVADGRADLRVRQRPGPDNMMGQMKFMFPNERGVYLHDTPLKALFAEDQRAQSAGCVRVQDAARLGRWLVGQAAVDAGRRPGAPEQEVDLASPTPVYLIYLTAAPGGGGGVTFRPDIYGRDALAIAALTGTKTAS